MASSLYLFTIGVFSDKHRTFILTICNHFGYNPEPIKLMLPGIDYEELISEIPDIKLYELNGSVGNVSLKELVLMNALIRIHKPMNIFEIGTFDGRTTLNIAANSQTDSKIFTLDLPKEDIGTTVYKLERGERALVDKKKSGEKFSGSSYKNKITQLYGDSADFDFTSFHNMIDFIFIDGSHAYDYVINDSNQALKMLRNGKGIILWHDYSVWKGVNMALNELYLKPDNHFQNMQHIRGTSLAILLVA